MFIQSQTAVLSDLAGQAKHFGDVYASAGRAARQLQSLGIDITADPPVEVDAAALAGTLAELSPGDVSGVLLAMNRFAAILAEDNPFVAGSATIGDSLNRLSLASR